MAIDRLRFLAGWDSATEAALLGQHLDCFTIRVADMFRKIERQPLIWHVKSPTALTLRRRMHAVLEWPELFERRHRLMDDWAGISRARELI